MKTESMLINEEYKTQKKSEKKKLANARKLEKMKMNKVKEYIHVPSKNKGDNKKIKRSKKRMAKSKIKKAKIIKTKNLTRIINKYKRGEKLFKYEEDYAMKKLIEKADLWFSRYIRYRDYKNGCITNGVYACSNKVENCCHRISRGWYSHRRDEDNCYGGCVSCNAYHQQEHGAMLERYQIKRFGIKRVEEQYKTRNKEKPTIDKLLYIINKYELKMRGIFKY